MKKWIAILMGLVGSLIFCSSVFAFQAYIPYLTGGYPEWEDYLQADNNSPTPASFTLILYNSSGMVAYNNTYTIPGKSRSLLNIKKGLSTSATTGIITYTSESLGFRLSYEYQAGGIAEFYLGGELRPCIALYFSDFSSKIVYKGAAVANLGSTAQTVSLYAIGSGYTLGQYATIVGAYGKIVGNPSTWFPGVDESQVEKIIAVAPTGCLDGVTLCSDSTLQRFVFTPAQKVSGFVADDPLDPNSPLDPNTATSGFATVYNEVFSNNDNGWDLTSTADSWARIQDGWYYLDAYDPNSSYYSWNEIPGFNAGKNFTIETSIRHIAGSATEAFGLTFGLQDIDNNFLYYVSDTGFYGVHKCEDGMWTQFASTMSSAVHTGANSLNNLKIIRIGNTLYFFLNDIQVFTMPFISFFGTDTGFHVIGDQRVAVDYLKITQEP
ncbi:MAG: hypothetical protein V1793_17500 [Pseudomonadota bacterium]